MNNNIEKEVNEQFIEFLKTKGIKAKFKLAFENMKESTKKQHETDIEAFNEVKAKSAEENKEFVEFLHTKGLKAKIQLIVENIKKGAKESKEKTKVQIQATKEIGKPKTYNASDLSREFNDFLKKNGLSNKYIVTIEEILEK